MFMRPTTKANRWQQMVNGLMSQATYIDGPEELTVAGQFKDLLRTYCTSHIRAMAPEEIDMGKPWTDGGITKFKLEGLLEFLHNRRFKGFTRAQIQEILKQMNDDQDCHGHKNINKEDGSRSTIRVWWVPAFENLEGALPIQEIDNDIPF